MSDEQNPGGSTPSPEASSSAPAAQTPDVASIVNAAVTSHLKRFTEKQLPSLFESALKPIHERLQAPAPVKDASDSKKNPEYAALEQKLAEFERKANESAARAAAAEKKQREDRAYGELRNNLQGKVNPDFLDMVSAHLFQVQRAVDFEDDGSPVFAMSRKTPYGDEDLRLPIKDGVEQWLKSEAAKPFIPAPGSSGATSKPKGVGGSINPQFDPEKATTEEKIRHAMAVAAAYENKL